MPRHTCTVREYDRMWIPIIIINYELWIFRILLIEKILLIESLIFDENFYPSLQTSKFGMSHVYIIRREKLFAISGYQYRETVLRENTFVGARDWIRGCRDQKIVWQERCGCSASRHVYRILRISKRDDREVTTEKSGGPGEVVRCWFSTGLRWRTPVTAAISSLINALAPVGARLSNWRNVAGRPAGLARRWALMGHAR